MEEKEVKNQPASKNFYLYVLNLIEKGRKPVQIAEDLGITKQRLNYYLSSLKKQKLIKKIGYGVWERSKKINPQEVKKSIRVANINPQKIFTSLKSDNVRGHAFQFKLELPVMGKNWKDREKIFRKLEIPFKSLNIFGGGQRLNFKGRKVWITEKSIIVYEKESIIAEKAKESQSQAINHFLKIIRALERGLRANFSIFGKYRFKVTRQHYSLIKNALAKQYDEHGKKLEVYSDSGLWFLIDNSFNLHEAETVHPQTAVPDNEKVQNFFNSLKKDPITTTEIINNLSEFKSMFKEISENQINAGMVLKQMDGNIRHITKLLGEEKFR